MACSLAMVIHCNLSFDMRYSNESSSWAWPGLTLLLPSPVLVSTFCKGQKEFVWKRSLHSLTHGAGPFLRSCQLSSYFPACYGTCRLYLLTSYRDLLQTYIQYHLSNRPSTRKKLIKICVLGHRRLLSSEMWCHVAWNIVTNVLDRTVASIFKIIASSKMLGHYLPNYMVSHPI
jgi:hypothetical protein